MPHPKLDIEGMSAEERLALIERIWNSLMPDEVGVTGPQYDELARRLDDLERKPGDSVSWNEAQRRIRERKR